MSNRLERDQFLNKALEAAGIPIFRIKAQSAYSVKEITNGFESAFNTSLKNQPEANPVSMDTVKVLDKRHDQETSGNPGKEQMVSVCPKCGAELVRRIATKGQHAGQKFWGCSNYPKCKFTKK